MEFAFLLAFGTKCKRNVLLFQQHTCMQVKPGMKVISIQNGITNSPDHIADVTIRLMDRLTA